MIEIRELSLPEGRKHVDALAEVLLDCVKGGASVSFMASLSKEEAESFFERALDAVERRERVLLAAFINGKLIGTVQIILATPPQSAPSGGYRQVTCPAVGPRAWYRHAPDEAS